MRLGHKRRNHLRKRLRFLALKRKGSIYFHLSLSTLLPKTTTARGISQILCLRPVYRKHHQGFSSSSLFGVFWNLATKIRRLVATANNLKPSSWVSLKTNERKGLVVALPSRLQVYWKRLPSESKWILNSKDARYFPLRGIYLSFSLRNALSPSPSMFRTATRKREWTVRLAH